MGPGELRRIADLIESLEAQSIVSDDYFIRLALWDEAGDRRNFSLQCNEDGEWSVASE